MISDADKNAGKVPAVEVVQVYVAPTTPSNSPPSKRALRLCQGVPGTWSEEGVENRNTDNVCYRILVRELRNVEVRERSVQSSRWNEQRGAIRGSFDL
jgi:hypothetical protein